MLAVRRTLLGRGNRVDRQRLEARAHQQRAGAGAAQDIGDLAGIEHEIDRYQHRAHARQREAHRRKGVRVARQDGDAVAGGDALLRQRGDQAVADLVEIAVAPLHVAADDGGLVGRALRRAPQDVSHAMLMRAADRRLLV